MSSPDLERISLPNMAIGLFPIAEQPSGDNGPAASTAGPFATLVLVQTGH